MRVTILLFFLAAATAIATFAVLRPGASPKTVVVLNNAAVTDRAFDGLRQGLAELGWREGEKVRFIRPGPQPSPALLRAQARDLIGPDTALVVTLSTPAALAARDVAVPLGVPMLLAPASDPVGVGLVSGLSHPGQAITGVAFALQEPRRLETLARLIPSARRIWVPYDSSDPSPAATVARLRAAAAKLDLTLVTADIRNAGELRLALDTLPRDIDAIFLPPDANLASNTPAVVAAATARGLAVTVPHRDGVAQGALFSYGFDLHALGRQAARLADRILSGISAADLPIETAEMELSINLATADQLGVTVPDDLLRHAVIIGRPEH